MAAYKLTYFDFRGKGEIIRLLFAQAGISYEDVRIQRSNWLSIKPGTKIRNRPAFLFYSFVCLAFVVRLHAEAMFIVYSWCFKQLMRLCRNAFSDDNTAMVMASQLLTLI